MSEEKDRHVVPDGDGWSVKVAGKKDPESRHATQADAEKAAKATTAKGGGGEVRIHGRDGKIRDSDTVRPAKDPNPPKGKKH
jgi:hypothetical protein